MKDTTPQTISVFDKLAQLYQDKFMDVSLYQTALDVFCDQLPAHATVLDVACGPGNVASYVLHKKPNLKWLGTDLAPAMLDLARSNNPTAEFQLLDTRHICHLKRRFDALVCSFALPYLSKTEAIQFISDASESLVTGGTIYISTMEDAHNKSGFERGSSGDEVYMNYHEASYLTEALQKHGFQLLHEERKHYDHNGKKTCDWIVVAKRA